MMKGQVILPLHYVLLNFRELFEPEALCEAFGELLLLSEELCGLSGIFVISGEGSCCLEILGVFHSCLESICVELDDVFRHACGSADHAGRAEPLVIVAEVAEERDILKAFLSERRGGECSENFDFGEHGGDVGNLYDTPVSFAAAEGEKLVCSVALGEVDVIFNAGGSGKCLSTDMVGSLSTVGGSAGDVLLSVSHEVVNGVETVIISADDNDRGLSDVVADRSEVFDGVGAELIDDGAVEVREVDEADGHAVFLGLSELGPADGAGAAVNVVDDDRLADVLLSVLAEDTGSIVGAVAGLIGNDHVYGAVGSPVSGCEGDCECKDNAENECQSKSLFHGFIPFKIYLYFIQ